MRHALRLVLVALALASPAAGAPDAPRGPLVRAVDSVGMTVSDMDRSVRFFEDVLTFTPVSDVEVAGEPYEHLAGVFNVRMRVVRLRLGDETLELTEYLAPRGRPVPPDTRSNDRTFQHVAIVVSDIDAAYAQLRAHRVEHVSAGPQRLPDWNRNAGGIRAFYFRDPDEHALELIQFPPGKGDPRWQRQMNRQSDALFLGIDHTAIVVADTDASLAFYRDTLGLGVAGESENYGTEQEHLNGVFGAHLRITALRAAHGPGIELLEYLSPHDGRPAPPDLQANDVAHWQTRLLARTADADDVLRKARATYVSPGIVALPAPAALGFVSGLTVRDPDGHVLQAVDAP